MKDYEVMMVKAEDIAQQIESRFINENANEDTMPFFEFEINLNDGE